MDQAIGANIFDSGSEDEEDAFPQRAAEPSAPGDEAAEDPAEGEDLEGYAAGAASDEDINASQEDQQPQGPPLTVEAPLIPGPEASKLRLLKATNILGINTRPFTPEEFAQTESVWEDQDGQRHVELRHHNTVRWRWKADSDGRLRPQSNARLVRWEDGTTQLFVGTEVLNASETDIASNHQHLFARHKDIIQGLAPLDQRITFQPASLTAAFHKRLTATADRRHAKQTRVRQFTTVRDPVQERMEREKREEQRIRDKEALERKQARMQRSYNYAREPVGRHGLTAGFLEAEGMDEGDIDEEGEDDGTLDGRQPLARGQLLNEEEEREREQRLARAKHDRPTKSKHRRTPPRGRQDDEMEGFIDDEDDEEDLRRRSKQQRRAVVLSDSDED